MSGGGEAGLTANTGAAGFGGAVQGFSVRQLLAFAESGVLLIYTYVFDCFKGEAESKGLPANDLTLVWLLLLLP